MTVTTDLSSSVSGAIADVLTSLRGKTLRPYIIIDGEGTEWFYDIVKKYMVRVPAGMPVQVSEYPEDEDGRIVVQTMNNDVIRVPKERIIKLGFH